MRAWVVPVPNPYVAVTGKDGSFRIKDAPVGEFMLMGWHERRGWIFLGPKKGDPKGAIVAIRDVKRARSSRPRPKSEPVTRPLRRRLAPMWHRTTGLCRSRVGVE